MAYGTAGLKCVVAGVGSGPAVWVYSSVDANGVVSGAAYFTDGIARGLRVGDVMFVVDTDTGAGNTTVHSVITVAAAGTTISPAILA